MKHSPNLGKNIGIWSDEGFIQRYQCYCDVTWLLFKPTLKLKVRREIGWSISTYNYNAWRIIDISSSQFYNRKDVDWLHILYLVGKWDGFFFVVVVMHLPKVRFQYTSVMNVFILFTLVNCKGTWKWAGFYKYIVSARMPITRELCLPGSLTVKRKQTDCFENGVNVLDQVPTFSCQKYNRRPVSSQLQVRM